MQLWLWRWLLLRPLYLYIHTHADPPSRSLPFAHLPPSPSPSPSPSLALPLPLPLPELSRSRSRSRSPPRRRHQLHPPGDLTVTPHTTPSYCLQSDPHPHVTHAAHILSSVLSGIIGSLCTLSWAPSSLFHPPPSLLPPPPSSSLLLPPPPQVLRCNAFAKLYEPFSKTYKPRQRHAVSPIKSPDPSPRPPNAEGSAWQSPTKGAMTLTPFYSVSPHSLPPTPLSLCRILWPYIVVFIPPHPCHAFEVNRWWAPGARGEPCGITMTHR